MIIKKLILLIAKGKAISGCFKVYVPLDTRIPLKTVMTTIGFRSVQRLQARDVTVISPNRLLAKMKKN